MSTKKDYLKLGFNLAIPILAIFLITSVTAFAEVSTKDQLDYQIISGIVLDVITDSNANSLIFTIQPTSDGQLTITIPRHVLDARIGGETRDFIVFVDGQTVPFNETTSSAARTLSIPFPHGTRSIEIIGTHLGSSPISSSDVKISVSTNKSTYYENDTIVISGEVNEILFGYAVSLLITGPNDDAVLIDQLKVDNYNKFQTEITAGGSMNEAGTGTYTINVLYATANRTASTTFQYNSLATTQPPITISTDKKVYKENEWIYFKYLISDRIPFGNLTIKLYDPHANIILIIKIPNHALSPHLSPYITFFPPNDGWGVGGAYSIIAEYGDAISIQGVKVITSQINIPPTGTITTSEESQIPDNDNDGVPDSKDQCPASKETFNGYLDADGCPDVPRIKPPFEKELLNGDEYTPYRYSFDFTKRPLIGISFGQNNYEQFQKVIPSVKNGVEMWTEPLEQKFGGDWSVDFVIITPQNQLQVKPDIIFNIETVESNEKCSGKQAWAFNYGYADSVKKIYKAKIPINIHHCYKLKNIEDPELFSWLSQMSYEPVNAHEFFHALGFEHTYNKRLDFMCGASPDISCPQGNPIQERYKGEIISDFDLTAIAYLYGVDGFQNPNKPVFKATKFTADDYLNFDASTYTTTPIPPYTTPIPTPPIISSQSKTVIPDWVKNVASFWCDDKIGVSSFLLGIQYLIDKGIIMVPATTPGVSTQGSPAWVKNNACFWSEGKITDEDFAQGIQYLIKKGIIQV